MEIPFRASAGPTLGVEWELQLVDPETRELGTAATELLDEIGRDHPGGEHPKAKHELMESTVEIITGICDTVDEALGDLAGTRAEVAEAAARRGLGLACAGSHPLSDWRSARISPDPRYARLIDDNQWLARRLQVFGVHVHTGVRSQDKAIPIVNALAAYLPHFLALSASSPFWDGADTGLASTRATVFALHTSGPPPKVGDWPEFETYMETLLRAGSIRSIKEVWWDIRPHPDFGTVELRICDGIPTLREVGMAAALTQSLVEMFDSQIDRGYTLPTLAQWVITENKWRATRYGLDARIIVQDDGTTAPLREKIAELRAELAPFAERITLRPQSRLH